MAPIGDPKPNPEQWRENRTALLVARGMNDLLGEIEATGKTNYHLHDGEFEFDRKKDIKSMARTVLEMVGSAKKPLFVPQIQAVQHGIQVYDYRDDPLRLESDQQGFTVVEHSAIIDSRIGSDVEISQLPLDPRDAALQTRVSYKSIYDADDRGSAQLRRTYGGLDSLMARFNAVRNPTQREMIKDLKIRMGKLPIEQLRFTFQRSYYNLDEDKPHFAFAGYVSIEKILNGSIVLHFHANGAPNESAIDEDPDAGKLVIGPESVNYQGIADSLSTFTRSFCEQVDNHPILRGRPGR